MKFQRLILLLLSLVVVFSPHNKAHTIEWWEQFSIWTHQRSTGAHTGNPFLSENLWPFCAHLLTQNVDELMTAESSAEITSLLVWCERTGSALESTGKDTNVSLFSWNTDSYNNHAGLLNLCAFQLCTVGNGGKSVDCDDFWKIYQWNKELRSLLTQVVIFQLFCLPHLW